MEYHNAYPRIITDETLRETVSHGNEEYPFCYYVEDIWEFDFHCIDWHWHSEVEFVFVREGNAALQIGHSQYVLPSGTGVFINTQVIHRFEAAEHTIIPNIVFSPSLLCSESSLIFRKYIRPVLHSSIDCQIYSPEIPLQKEILDILLAVFSLQESGQPCEMKTVQLLMTLWEAVYRNIPAIKERPVPKSSARTQAQLQIMMQYIHNNYPHQISLDDIAKTVSLSKSSALHIFNHYLHISPVSYLIHYRLKCAAKLLISTESSISTIAQNTGFESTGYFCRKFKELFRQTPGDYRKNERYTTIH